MRDVARGLHPASSVISITSTSPSSTSNSPLRLTAGAMTTMKICSSRTDWRQNALVADGWRVLRFTWRMLKEHPEVVVAAIRQALISQ
jgi:hypothetical protein